MALARCAGRLAALADHIRGQERAAQEAEP
jgi:hypothetical protein